MSAWKRVTRNDPCPICRKPDWCAIAPDGDAVLCMRVESDHPVTCGADTGHMHQLRELLPRRLRPRRHRRAAAGPQPQPDTIGRAEQGDGSTVCAERHPRGDSGDDGDGADDADDEAPQPRREPMPGTEDWAVVAALFNHRNPNEEPITEGAARKAALGALNKLRELLVHDALIRDWLEDHCQEHPTCKPVRLRS